MTNEKNIQYKKAYVELNEILKVLSKEQKEKIPKNFINNISNNMDKNYKFTLILKGKKLKLVKLDKKKYYQKNLV